MAAGGWRGLVWRRLRPDTRVPERGRHARLPCLLAPAVRTVLQPVSWPAPLHGPQQGAPCPHCQPGGERVLLQNVIRLHCGQGGLKAFALSGLLSSMMLWHVQCQVPRLPKERMAACMFPLHY